MSRHGVGETARDRRLRQRIAAEVFARDRGACWLCGQATDPSKPYPHPLAPTLDHVQPRSRGGPTTAANCKCAHYLCNTLRGSDERPWGPRHPRTGRLLAVASGVAEGDWPEKGIGKRALRQAVLIGLAYALRRAPQYAV